MSVGTGVGAITAAGGVLATASGPADVAGVGASIPLAGFCVRRL
jgi:hypothetical protein